MSPTTSLAGNIVQRASPTKNRCPVTGCFQQPPGIFVKQNQNTTIKWMKWGWNGGAAVS
jgi:hypothetical protein